MAAEDIGNLIPTKIPGYADDADIQAALRVYHYGSYDYSPSNTSPASLVSPSMAKTIYDIEQDILSLDSSKIDTTIFVAKGDILTASAANTPTVLTVGSNNQFLIANSGTATGLQWSNTLASPIVSGLTLSDASIIFEGTTADDFETTLTVVNPTADRTITLPNVSGTVVTTGDTGTVSNTMLAGSIANSKLANSTISGISLGSNLNALTISTGLSGTSYNGSSAVTISIDSTVATTSGTQTLTNKTFTDSTTTFQDNTDTSKKMQFELSGISAATTRTLTIPNVNGTIVTTGDSGTVTSTMIADGTIVNSDINASASIAVSKLAASTISGVTLGNNLNTLTISTGLSGTSYNGSSAVTIAIDSTVATTSGTQTLTNKTLLNPVLKSAGGTIFDFQTTSGVSVFTAGNDVNGNLEIGRRDNVASTPFLDFHSGATTVDYDSRIVASGGNGTSGNGTLNIQAATLQWNSTTLATQTYSANASNLTSGTVGTARLASGTASANTVLLGNQTWGTVPNAGLTNSSITINSTAISLGGSGTITAANPNALTIGTGLSGTSYTGASAVTIAIDSTVATTSGTQTLTNKTFTDSNTTFQDESDNSKKMQFQLSGISGSTTRTLTVPNNSGTIALTSDLSSYASSATVDDNYIMTLMGAIL